MNVQRVVAVVPTYRPDGDLYGHLIRLREQCDAVIVVDDGSPGFVDILAGIAATGAELIVCPENRGIASALNTGIRLALERGAEFVLTVDQDTMIPVGYVEACVEVLTTSSVRLGIACPAAVNGSLGRPGKITPEGVGILRVAIQSGFVITAECLRECGLFDERLFIDMVDTEYCLRLARLGYFIGAVPGTDIIHSLGEGMPLRRWGRPIVRNGVVATYEYHRPARQYYMFRNTVDLHLRFMFTNPRWVVSSMRHELSSFVNTVMSGPHSRKQVLAALIGVCHGLVRRRGALGPRVRRLLATP